MSSSANDIYCGAPPHPGRPVLGALAPLTATDLATTVLRELVERTGLQEGDVDDVILGNGYASGEDPAIGRIAALDAGLRQRRARLQIDRRCGRAFRRSCTPRARSPPAQRTSSWPVARSRCHDVEHYALGLRSGVEQGGIELLDRLDRARETAGGKDHPIAGGMIETAENLRREYGIGREEQDELALRSDRRAVAAHEAGKFADELVPVTVPGGAASPSRLERGRRRACSSARAERGSDRARARMSSSTATSTRVPTSPSRSWPRSARSG